MDDKCKKEEMLVSMFDLNTIVENPSVVISYGRNSAGKDQLVCRLIEKTEFSRIVCITSSRDIINAVEAKKAESCEVYDVTHDSADDAYVRDDIQAIIQISKAERSERELSETTQTEEKKKKKSLIVWDDAFSNIHDTLTRRLLAEIFYNGRCFNITFIMTTPFLEASVFGGREVCVSLMANIDYVFAFWNAMPAYLSGVYKNAFHSFRSLTIFERVFRDMATNRNCPAAVLTVYTGDISWYSSSQSKNRIEEVAAASSSDDATQ